MVIFWEKHQALKCHNTHRISFQFCPTLILENWANLTPFFRMLAYLHITTFNYFSYLSHHNTYISSQNTIHLPPQPSQFISSTKYLPQQQNSMTSQINTIHQYSASLVPDTHLPLRICSYSCCFLVEVNSIHKLTPIRIRVNYSLVYTFVDTFSNLYKQKLVHHLFCMYNC